MSIIVDKVSYKYSPNTVYETVALDKISLTINDGEFIGIIGATGSGKSTFIQHLNGLLKATEGTIYFNGEDIYDKDYDLTALRLKVGMAFQYPDHQLFESTVLEDVKFGPKNQGLKDKEASIRAYEALETLKFPRELIDQSPFDLSGGQKKLAAIAGILAMKPSVLILDEPTAGVDPKGSERLLEILKSLNEKQGLTIILVSHSMEDVARFVGRILVMDKGKFVLDSNPKEVFSHSQTLESIGLRAPEVCYLMKALRDKGLPVSEEAITEEEAAYEILRALKHR